MAKYLVIVESPAKVKTIKNFLGQIIELRHLMDMYGIFPKSQFGIDVEHDFEPKYITISGKGEFLQIFAKQQKKQIRFILQLTLTVRERQFPGI